MVRPTPKKQDGKVFLKIDYTASRMDGEASEEGHPESTTFTIESTNLIEIGKPLLVGGSSSESSNYLLLKIDSR